MEKGAFDVERNRRMIAEKKTGGLPVNPKAVRRILIIRRWLIGDVLVTTPALRSVRRHFPRAHIAFLTGQAEKEALLNNPDIDELLVESPGLFKRIQASPAYDLVINFELANAYSEICCILARAKFCIGRWKQISSPRVRVYNAVPAAKLADNIINDRLTVTKALGLTGATRKTRMYLTGAERRFARDYLQQFRQPGRAFIGIHPGGHTDELRPHLWKAGNFAALADRIISCLPAVVLIFKGPGEERVAARVYRRVRQKKFAFAVPVFPLRLYASLIGECGMFIAHDRGPMHIAAALGVKTAGIFTAGEAPFWFPYEKKDGCVYIQEKRVGDISVAEVLNAVIEVCKGRNPRNADNR